MHGQKKKSSYLRNRWDSNPHSQQASDTDPRLRPYGYRDEQTIFKPIKYPHLCNLKVFFAAKVYRCVNMDIMSVRVI